MMRLEKKERYLVNSQKLQANVNSTNNVESFGRAHGEKVREKVRERDKEYIITLRHCP